MAQNMPFNHPSISDLAKSLRKSISSAHRVDIGQVEMLQLLAKASGFQNYQSLKQYSEGNFQNNETQLIVVSCTLREVNEVFERDSRTGKVIDRRHQKTDNVLAAATITVKTRLGEASARCIVIAAVENLSDRELITPERTLATLLMKHVALSASSFFNSLDMMSETKVVISEELIRSHHQIDETKRGELIVSVNVDDYAYQRIVSQSVSIDKAIERYKSSIEFLKNLAYSEKITLSADEKKTATESLSFIENAIEISTAKGGISMYSWNSEKFPAIARFVNALIKGKKTM